jgi:hypothetical protein
MILVAGNAAYSSLNQRDGPVNEVHQPIMMAENREKKKIQIAQRITLISTRISTASTATHLSDCKGVTNVMIPIKTLKTLSKSSNYYYET